MSIKTNEQYIQELIKEFTEQRDALKSMIVELEGIQQNVKKLFPEKLDARNKYKFEHSISFILSHRKLIRFLAWIIHKLYFIKK